MDKMFLSLMSALIVALFGLIFIPEFGAVAANML